jgi:hypothetical protein
LILQIAQIIIQPIAKLSSRKRSRSNRWAALSGPLGPAAPRVRVAPMRDQTRARERVQAPGDSGTTHRQGFGEGRDDGTEIKRHEL